MLKKKLLFLGLVSSLALVLFACGTKKDDKAADLPVVKIASQMPSMVDIVKIAGKTMEEEGYKLELIKVNDNIQYNEILNNKEVDANFAQHEPFMQKFNQEKGANLVVVQKIYNAKVGFYSKNVKNIADVPNGSKVAIPNDVSNEGRALAILADAGLIKLKDGVGFNGTLKDITENPHDLQWLSVDLINLAEAYNEKDVSLVFNYPTYIEKLNLSPKDALILEKNVDERFAISLVAREDNKDSAEVKALIKAMTTPEVKKYLEEKHGDTLVPAF